MWNEDRVVRYISYYSEFLQQKWTKKNKGELSPNICHCIDRFNMVTRWVTKEILGYDHTRQRAVAISKMVQVAMMCLKLNNFTTVFQIAAAINAMPVQRLKKSWEQVQHTVREVTFRDHAYGYVLRPCLWLCLETRLVAVS